MKIAILTLALTCFGQSYKYEKVTSSSGKDMTVFTPPKAGTPPSDTAHSTSFFERCSNQGFLTSYPQPGTLGDLNGTRKCYDYCYSLSFIAALCLEHYCKCLTFNPTFMRTMFDETLGQSYKKVTAGGKNMAVFTPPKEGIPPLQKEESVSFSERCSNHGFLTSYPQPGTLGDLNGTRKCYDYCYSRSYNAALCLKEACTCLVFPVVSKASSRKHEFKVR
jgi:hypothetical protein